MSLINKRSCQIKAEVCVICMCYTMSYMYVLSYVFDVFVILCVIGVQVLSTVKKNISYTTIHRQVHISLTVYFCLFLMYVNICCAGV